MSNTDKVRERIARIMLHGDNEENYPVPFEGMDTDIQVAYRHMADAVLSDPDILVKAEDQSTKIVCVDAKTSQVRDIIVKAMLATGWVKTEKKN